MKPNDYMYRDIEDLEKTLGYEVNEAVKQGFMFGRMKWGKLADYVEDNAQALAQSERNQTPTP